MSTTDIDQIENYLNTAILRIRTRALTYFLICWIGAYLKGHISEDVNADHFFKIQLFPAGTSDIGQLDIASVDRKTCSDGKMGWC